jgi:cyclomaltodextrinase / maltogenic alpha-amylase / neopullulanase
MHSSINSRFFYHIYPLGMCGAPKRNDFTSQPADGLRRLIDRIPHLTSLGVNALYIGPLFESTAHGYDTADFFKVDRRLGTNDDLKKLVRRLHDAGIAVVLDAVFNHTGRDFFAFRDIQAKGRSSAYTGWYRGIDFSRRSPAGDAFAYEGWAGNYDLVKLEPTNRDARNHLLDAARYWITEFDVDGLRLDTADILAPDFMDELASACKAVKPDFWLMGEVVHGDYRSWVRPGRLDSVTNYELHKSLWSSFNDRNFFELSWNLNREFGTEGMYRDLTLYNFLDNHDVNRLASTVKDRAHLVALYGLLFTVPGVPSVYYGSEWGLRGEKKEGSDAELRPAIRETAEHGTYSGVPDELKPVVDSAEIENAIRRFARVRAEHPALANGSYRQLHVASEQFAFIRESAGERIVVAVNAAPRPVTVTIGSVSNGGCADWADALESGATARETNEHLRVDVAANGIRILRAAN